MDFLQKPNAPSPPNKNHTAPTIQLLSEALQFMLESIFYKHNVTSIKPNAPTIQVHLEPSWDIL